MGLKDPDGFMTLLKAGFTVTAIITGRHRADRKLVPGLGSRPGFVSHCREFPKWGAEAAALQKQNDLRAKTRKGRFKREMTNCVRGHPLSGSNLGFNRGTSRYPGPWRYCKACHAEASARGVEMTDMQIAKATAAVKAGVTINDITRSRGNRKAICKFVSIR